MATQSVVQIPLKTEKWQADRIDKLMETYRQIYNTMLSVEIKSFRGLLRDPEYKSSKEVIDSVYKISDSVEKTAAKKSEAYQNAVKKQYEMLLQRGFSEFGFVSEVAKHRSHFKTNTNSVLCARSIATPMWAAFEKVLFGNGERVRFKRKTDAISLVSDCRTGIRIVNEEKQTVRTQGTEKKLYVAISSAQGAMYVPLNLVAIKNDYYKLAMLQREYRTARIVRKEVNGKSTFMLQISVLGEPEEKIDVKTGEIKHRLGSGKVGMYIDTTDCVCVTEAGETHYFDLSAGIPDYSDKYAAISQLMDASRRATNPDNFNSDGTIKNGRMENGHRTRLNWNYSKKYQKLRAESKNLHRVETERRTIARHILANSILALGDDFICNDYSFEYAQRRKKEDEFSDSGRQLSKKKGGAKIGHNAPATLLTMMDQALTAKGKEKIRRVKLGDIDRTEKGYKAFYAKEMLGM